MTPSAADRSAGVRAIPASGRVLGIDPGTKRVGVAVSDGDQRLAMPATTLVRYGDRPREHRALAELVREYEAVGVVFGLPLSLSGAEGPAAAGARAEAAQLARLLTVPVELTDERLTTVEAASALLAAGHPPRRQRRVIDQVAAAVLLQSWLDRRAAQQETGGGDRAETDAVEPRTAEMEQPGT